MEALNNVMKCCGERHGYPHAKNCKLMKGNSIMSHYDEQRSSEVKQVLESRGKRYGEYTDLCRVSQQIKQIIRENSDNPLPYHQQEALDLIATKIARITVGDSSYTDNWTDIAGYCELVLKNMADTPPSTF